MSDPVSKPGKPNRHGSAAPAFTRCARFPNTHEEPDMATKRVKPIPEGMHSLTPHIVCAGAADAIEFYKKAFNAKEEGRVPGPDGKLMHAMVRIGDSALMLVDEMPQWGALGPKSLKGSPVTIHLYVEDVDATVAQAVKAGAKVTMPVDEAFWGDRYGQLEDPFGHKWSVATHTRDLTHEQILEGMKSMDPECGDAAA